MNETWGTKLLSKMVDDLNNGVKAEELRIGNWVKFNGCPVQIRELQYMSKLDVYLDSNVNVATYKPIPLTEEILLKCGFKKQHFVQYPTYKLGSISLTLVEFFDEDASGKEFSFKEWKLSELNNDNLFYYKSGVSIKCLHQLQNLYFALTGEELEIKL